MVQQKQLQSSQENLSAASATIQRQTKEMQTIMEEKTTLQEGVTLLQLERRNSTRWKHDLPSNSSSSQPGILPNNTSAEDASFGGKTGQEVRGDSKGHTPTEFTSHFNAAGFLGDKEIAPENRAASSAPQLAADVSSLRGAGAIQ